MGLQSGKPTATGDNFDSQRRLSGARSLFGEDSPDAMRRRAELLLDEMMLGAVDGGGDNGASLQPKLEAHAVAPAANGVSTHTRYDAPYEAPFVSAVEAPPETQNGGTPRAAVWGEQGYNGNDPAGANAGAPSVHAPFDYSYTATTTAPATPGVPGGSAVRPLTAAEDRYAQVAGAGSTYMNGDPFTAQGSSAVRRQNASFASTMTVGARMPNRSNLLPRNNAAATEEMQEEIRELLTRVATDLPPGHEAVERSRHLLQKAQNILQTDPTRSAEVEYYLQQVRRIVQRTRQTATWSDVYRNRLRVYLWGWVLLGLVAVSGLAVGQGAAVLELVGAFQLSVNEVLVTQILWVAAAGFVGALGAALSVLFQMRQYAQQEHAYFDRKYGLRGLLLPLLGWFFAAGLALIWVAIFAVVGIDLGVGSLAFWALLLLAWLVGLGQPWLYGAR